MPAPSGPSPRACLRRRRTHPPYNWVIKLASGRTLAMTALLSPVRSEDRQGVLEIGDQIIDILDSNRKPQEIRRDAERRAAFLGD